MRDDWLCLRVPVWLTDIEFVPESQRIITATGHHQVQTMNNINANKYCVLLIYQKVPFVASIQYPLFDVGPNVRSFNITETSGGGHDL